MLRPVTASVGLGVYVLYGHLKSINVWVGKEVQPNEAIGIMGLAEGSDRHLHIEIHSYGQTTTGYYSDTQTSILPSGILPVGGIASNDIAPYEYDLVQFLPSPPGLTNGNLATLVSTANIKNNNDSAELDFTGGCKLTYSTHIKNTATGKTLLEADGYRGYDFYPPKTPPFVSPLLVTTPPA